MESTLIHSGTTVVRRVIPRSLQAHPFVTLLVVGLLFGGGLRFIPASTAAVPGSSAEWMYPKPGLPVRGVANHAASSRSVYRNGGSVQAA